MAVGNDRRIREVSLTSAGRKILAEAEPLWRRAQRVFENEIGTEESAAMRAILHRAAGSELAYP